MEFSQLLAMAIFATTLLTWLTKNTKNRKIWNLVNSDKIARSKLLDKYYFLYFPVIIIIAGFIAVSPAISSFIANSFNYYLSSDMIILIILISSNMISLYIRKFFKYSSINNKVLATPYSNYNMPAKKRKLGVLEDSFLDEEKQTYFNYIIRTDDFTIQKIEFKKEAIEMKLIYVKMLFKANRFFENDFNILDKIENNISSRNKFNFSKSENFETRIKEIIKAILSERKYSFSFGHIKQYSDSMVLDELLVFLTDMQEDKYTDNSLPYLLYFRDYIK